MSIPLTFYMTGDATTWTTNMPVGVNGFEAGSAWWALLNEFWTRNAAAWDGNVADTINWSGSGLAGMPNGSPMATRFVFTFGAPSFATTSEEATFCIDSCAIPNTTPPDVYNWLFDVPSPSFGGPICWSIKKQPNVNAEFTNCPTMDLTSQFHIPFSYDFNASEPPEENDTPFEFAVLSGPGTINSNGLWAFDPECADVGSHDVIVGVRDTQHPEYDSCLFSITVLNTPPTISGGCGQTITVGTGATKTLDFNAADANTGDVLTFSVATADAFGGAFGIDPVTGLFTVSPISGDEGLKTFTATVTDCAGATASCDFFVDVISEVPFKIVIEKVHDQLQGHHAYVDVYVEEGSEIMLGFDLLIGYDPSVLAFVGAVAGPIFDMEGAYQWEYFTYRYNYNGNCGNGCPSGLLRVVGMAEYNDGPHHPNLVVLPSGTVLFTLDFLVSSDYNVGGSFAPVYWYWMDCGDNAIAFNYRSADPLDVSTGLSLGVFHYNGDPYYEVTDPYFGFPTYFGAQAICFEMAEPGKPLPVPFVYFYGGGVDIVYPGDIDARGDVNLNGVANEIADAVVFTNYFIYGLSAFTINIEGQKAATEINGDGIALTVADLVYLIRVIVGDALPLPKDNPNIVLNAVVDGQSVTVDNEVGAAYFVLAGDVPVTLGSGAAGMELATGLINGNTVALVYSFEKGLTASGNVINTTGELISVEAANYNGIAYSVSIIPANFSLKNYPNPFNPATTIEMSLPQACDWSIDVYNVLGQKVASYSGTSEAGVVSVDFDGSQIGSGVFFYRAQAGAFSATEKMVMLK
ncbi:MAG: T9SS type A sorting domain-containing protein [Candidatus Zixiibacteriota bacterium]